MDQAEAAVLKRGRSPNLDEEAAERPAQVARAMPSGMNAAPALPPPPSPGYKPVRRTGSNRPSAYYVEDRTAYEDIDRVLGTFDLQETSTEEAFACFESETQSFYVGKEKKSDELRRNQIPTADWLEV